MSEETIVYPGPSYPQQVGAARVTHNTPDDGQGVNKAVSPQRALSLMSLRVLTTRSRQRKSRTRRGLRTAGQRLAVGRLLSVSLALLIAFTFIAAVISFAQSGRQSKSSTTDPPSSETQRPKRATTTGPTSDIPPAPNPTPQPRVPNAADEVGVDDDDVVRINSNLVTVPASVVDHRGRAITDLTAKDFELRIDGEPKPISELSRSETPVRMALLFDNSGSQTPARELQKQAAIKFFRSVLRPVDQAAVYSVSTIPVLEQPLTNDVQTLVHTIERFGKPEGATALLDAIAQAAIYLRPHKNRKVIIIVSDGADTVSDMNFDTVLRRVQATDCQIYAVRTGHSNNANLRDLVGERRLEEFAAQTGGAVYVPQEMVDLDAAFTQIAADLAQQYVLSCYASDDQLDGRFRTISLRVLTRPDARVRTRRGYYARVR